MKINEIAGVRFTEDSKEYKLARIIRRDCLNKNVINLDLLKDALPDNMTDELKEQYFKFISDYITNISVYSRDDYKNFLDWVDKIYVITISAKDGKNFGFSGAYKPFATVYGNDNKIKSCIIIILKEDELICDTIIHELRHAYTDYIEHMQKFEQYSIDSEISSSKISLSNAEILTLKQIKNDDFYNHLIQDNETFCDYKNGRLSKNQLSYEYFIDKLFYYLVGTEMKSYLENAYNNIRSLYSKLNFALCSGSMIRNSISQYMHYEQALNSISNVLRNNDVEKKWSEYNNNLLGILGAKVVALRQKRDIRDTDKRDARPWFEYKRQQLIKILKNINTIIQKEGDKARAKITDGEIIIKRGYFDFGKFYND